MSADSKNLNRKAFSLWEIVIALTVFVVGIYGIISLTPVLRQSSDRSLLNSESLFLSQMIGAEIKKDNAIMDDDEFVQNWDKNASELIFSPLPPNEREVVGIRDMNFRTTVRGGMEGFWKVKLNIYSARQGSEIFNEFIYYVPKDDDYLSVSATP